jgi:hypothetical protein
MRRTTLLATAVFACFVVMAGCRDRTVEQPAAERRVVHRSTAPWAPPVTAVKAEPTPIPEPATPEPAMSIPPEDEAMDTPAAAPEPTPAAPLPPPSQYEDGCGRPLVT